MTPKQPDPIAYLTGQLSGRPYPRGVGPPGLGEKFHPDGAVQIWPGNTFICPIDQASDAFAAMLEIQEALMCSAFAPFYAFLPPPSFHMTVFQGTSPETRPGGFWPDGAAPDLSHDALTDLMLKRTNGLEVPTAFCAKALDLFGGHSMTVTGADDASEAGLRLSRNRLRQATGLTPPEFATYVFHITLAYPLRWQSPSLAAEVVAFSQKLFDGQSVRLQNIALGPIEFCRFDSMHHFEPLNRLT
ncbi:MAG: DUF1868 domain-containing protein [Pseudomonadota bacterium]